MSEDKPSPSEKTGSSSLQSDSPIQSALGSWIAATRNERVRASSWDDSDEDAPAKPEKPVSNSRRLYSADAEKTPGSVASEINEIKKQFFENLKNEDQKSESESVRRDARETKTTYDRRQSPARIRRRSSSGSSPVREAQSLISSEERELDQISLRSVENDTKFYLNHFFAELKSKQVGREDPAGKDDAGQMYDSECVEMYNQLTNWETRDAEGFLCKTSRKLSQILEVEENRKDLDKKSEENLDLFRRNFKSPEEFSPLETARSTKEEKVFGGLRLGQVEEKFKPLNFEDFGNFHASPYPSRGSLSERTGRAFQAKIQDDFISLSAKTGTTQLISPIRDETDAAFQYFCFANPMGIQNFPRDVFAKDKGQNSESNDSPKNDLTGDCTPKKIEENRSDRLAERIKSGNSRTGNLESPKFMLSIDSARSLKVEDLDTPDTNKKDDSGKSSKESNSKRSQKSVEAPPSDVLRQSRESSTRRSHAFGLDDLIKANSNSSRSDNSFEKNVEKSLASPDSCKSSKQEPTPPSSRGRKASGERGMQTAIFYNSRRVQKDSNDEQSSGKTDGATWRDLIDAFQESSDQSFNLEDHFPGFPRQRKNFWDWERENGLDGNKPEVERDDEPQESTDGRLMGTDSSLDASMKEADENIKNRNLDYKDCLLEKIQKEEGAGPLKTPQNLFYFNVDERGPFGIGEFGDVTYCTTGNSDTVDFGKPKDHGDGIPTQGVIAFDKSDKDAKRQLWTELRKDVRLGTRKDGTDDPYLPRYVPVNAKASKSDNLINARIHEEIPDEYLNIVKTRNFPEFERVRRETKSTSKTVSECSRSEIWSEDFELDCERTPRLTKSLPDLGKLSPKNDSRNTVGSFEKATAEWKEAENLNVILTCEKDETQSKNWLNLKTPDRKESRKRGKKSKTKHKKKETSPKEPFREYLSVRKSRQPVPPLKLRNSNCFQNFYKRFISVFCLTSNSSAATSK